MPQIKLVKAGRRLLKTQKDLEQFLTWLAFLQIQVIPKAKGTLQDGWKCCCLGTGCVVTISERELKTLENEIRGGMPTDQKAAPNWLKEIDNNFETRTGVALTDLNDGGSGYKARTHPEIAKILLMVYENDINRIYGKQKLRRN